MNGIEAALVDIVRHLESQEIPYMVIGGVANLHWGRPRLTQDVDLKIQLAEAAWPDFVDGLRPHFTVLTGDPLTFMGETRVLPIATSSGFRVDLVLAGLPYEEEAIRRAQTVQIAGQAIRLCTAEDLILHKIISDRARDREDVEGVILSRGVSLDRSFLDGRIQALANDLENPDILDFYRACLKKAGLRP